MPSDIIRTLNPLVDISLLCAIECSCCSNRMTQRLNAHHHLGVSVQMANYYGKGYYLTPREREKKDIINIIVAQCLLQTTQPLHFLLTQLQIDDGFYWSYFLFGYSFSSKSHWSSRQMDSAFSHDGYPNINLWIASICVSSRDISLDLFNFFSSKNEIMNLARLFCAPRYECNYS